MRKLLGTKTITSLPTGGMIQALLDDDKAYMSVKNIVSYVKRRYPRNDGMTYATKYRDGIVTISVVPCK